MGESARERAACLGPPLNSFTASCFARRQSGFATGRKTMKNESTTTEVSRKSPASIESIEPEYQERYAELLEIVKKFCLEHLNEEYLDSCYLLAADICQEGSPVNSGRARSWAAGLIWTIGRVNFLTDRSNTPHMKQEQFAKLIGVSKATISAKSNEIWNALGIVPLDPDYVIASQVASNPFSALASFLITMELDDEDELA
jgi:DNA-binding XRE family transcriptional regulator